MRRYNYDDANAEYPSDQAYTVRGWRGVAFVVLGWETEPDEATEWTGQEVRTGNLLVVMIGDDKRHSVDPDDVSPIAEEEFCRECGQIGCGHSA